jgi:hypothetical protein
MLYKSGIILLDEVLQFDSDRRSTDANREK